MGSVLENKPVFRAELHVHTPSSSCYKGPKTDDEYLKIIEIASEKKIDILAITDHNSIKGYSRIQSLWQKTKNEYNALVGISDSKEAKAKAKLLKRTLDAFDSLLLLPGVEFEVNNGIHLLVLFNPEISIATIEDFLKEGGYEENTFGRENDVFSNWSIFDLYKESKNYDCVVLDAHSDSTKGVFNTLTGQARVHAFTDSALAGICYKNENQKNSIESIISQHSRNTTKAFLKSSDAHQTAEIGRDLSFFRIDDKSWNSFKEAFDNPTECIFTTFPEIQSIIKNVACSDTCLFIGRLEENTHVVLSHYICGLANSNGGYIILGADSAHSINGISEERLEEIDLLWRTVHDIIPGLTNIRFTLYPVRDKTIVLVVRVTPSVDLLGVEQEDCIYCFQNKKIEKLNAFEIQSLITSRLSSRFSERINCELDSIRKKTFAIDTYIKSLPILNSFYSKSVLLTSVISEVTPVPPCRITSQQFASLKDSFEKYGNGVSRGNIYFFENEQKPRLSDAFLRITLPCYNVRGLKPAQAGHAIIFVPGGAVFYTEKILNVYYNTQEPILKVVASKDYSTKFLCAYLKSSFHLWYLLNRFNSLDVIPPSSFNCVRVPQLYPKRPDHSSIVKEIEGTFDKIIEIEKNFLPGQNKIKTPEELCEYIMAHNKSVEILFNNIDESIFNLLGLTDDERQTIRGNLSVNSIYVPEEAKCKSE